MSKKYNSKRNMVLGNYLKTGFDNHLKQTRRYSNTDNLWLKNFEVMPQDKKDYNLLIYAFEGNRKIVKVALECGANINAVDMNGNNALILAIYSGQFEVVDEILSFNFKSDLNLDLNKFNNDKVSAMHLAVKLNNGKMVKLLFSCGANLELVGKYRKTPIFEAVENNNDEMIELISSLGANINAKNREGHTPLMVASFDKLRQDSFLKLVSLGANILERDNEGKNVFMHAANNNNSVYMDILLKRTSSFEKLIDVQDRNGISPLMTLAKRGNREAIRVLVSRGANIFLKDNFGRTAYDIAIKFGNPTCSEILDKAKRIYEKAETIEDEKQKELFLKQNLSIFAKQNRVANSCVK